MKQTRSKAMIERKRRETKLDVIVEDWVYEKASLPLTLFHLKNIHMYIIASEIVDLPAFELKSS